MRPLVNTYWVPIIKKVKSLGLFQNSTQKGFHWKTNFQYHFSQRNFVHKKKKEKRKWENLVSVITDLLSPFDRNLHLKYCQLGWAGLYYTTESYRQWTFTIGKNHVIIAHKSRKNKNSAQILQTKKIPFQYSW